MAREPIEARGVLPAIVEGAGLAAGCDAIAVGSLTLALFILGVTG